MKEKTTGIVFIQTNSGSYYYINEKRDFIWIEDIRLLSTDKVFKDIVIKTAKRYTHRGYNILCNKLHKISSYPINNEHVKNTWWFETNYFTKKEYHNLDFLK